MSKFSQLNLGQQALVLGMGLIGGVTVGSWAANHLFVEGLEDKERRQLILFGAASAMAFGAAKLLDLQGIWRGLVDVGALAEEGEKLATEKTR